MINITCTNAITTVKEDSNLPKTYFNINGKFNTKETTFYIYLANDVYEIPLAKLQVNGTSQTTMQGGINALAAILLNAGASGGGGGNSALPINDLGIDLYTTPYTANNYGIYKIIGSGDGSNKFEFPDPTAFAGKTIIVHNQDINPAYYATTNAPYNGNNTQLLQINTETIHTYISYSNKWYLTSVKAP